jgi:hypothetical protein
MRRIRHLGLAALVLLLSAPGSGQESDDPSPPRTTTTTLLIELHGPVETVFSLFLPTNRTRWDQEWEIKISSPRGEPGSTEGMVFERLSDPGIVWTIVALDEEANTIEFSYERPKLYDMKVQIQCEERSPEITTATVTYTASAKSKLLREALAKQLPHQIEGLVKGDFGWEKKINHYLETGRKLEPFLPLAIERRHTIEFSESPGKIFAMMNPADGNHWTPRTPKYVFGSPEEPSGAMWMMGDGWMVVAEYDPDAMYMKSVLYIPDIEFMMEEVRCQPGPEGGTTAAVTWRVAGISEDGNDAVQGFFDSHWDKRMKMIEETYN